MYTSCLKPEIKIQEVIYLFFYKSNAVTELIINERLISLENA